MVVSASSRSRYKDTTMPPSLALRAAFELRLRHVPTSRQHTHTPPFPPPPSYTHPLKESGEETQRVFPSYGSASSEALERWMGWGGRGRGRVDTPSMPLDDSSPTLEHARASSAPSPRPRQELAEALRRSLGGSVAARSGRLLGGSAGGAEAGSTPSRAGSSRLGHERARTSCLFFPSWIASVRRSVKGSA